ncbi:phage tail termination protein [Enterobacter sp. A4]|uniref:phage tail termination protein n=2 Tax=Enterobacteriaceae TaxID=543 RepID=UPI003D20B778
MNPLMYQWARNMFGDAGLTTGFLVQLLNFNDPNDLSKSIMVVQAKCRNLHQKRPRDR